MSLQSKRRTQLLPSAARTATTVAQDANGKPFRDQYGQVIRLYLDVTAASGSGGLSPRLRGYDPVSGKPVEISTGGAAVTAIGTYVYEIGLAEGTAAGNVKERVGAPLPEIWDVNVVHGDGTSYTYSLGCEVIP